MKQATFVNSITVWYRSDYREDRTHMAILFPKCMFGSDDAIIEWAVKQKPDVSYLIAYDGKADVVLVWNAGKES